MQARFIVKLVGGLGNQLFAYATARRLALVNSAPLAVDLSFFGTDLDYGRQYELSAFRISPDDVVRNGLCMPGVLGKLARHAEQRAARYGLLRRNDYLVEERANQFEPAVLDYRIGKKDTVLIGYWQNEKYFSDIEDQIRSEFTLNVSPQLSGKSWAQQVERTNSVAVHIRRLHQTRVGTTNDVDRFVLPPAYYRHAFDIIRQRVADPKFFCFTDFPIAVREFLPHGYSISIVSESSGSTALSDFELMRRCKHFIISNSTFSWWAAWLGSHPNKTVIAPRAGSVRYAAEPASKWLSL